MSAIGVVVAVRDVTEFLEVALDSVARQTKPAHQLVIVDDGSTVPVLIEPEWVKGIATFTMFRSEVSLGLSRARNRGVELLEPEVSAIAFLDADDVWPPNRLELLDDEMQRAEADLAFGSLQNCDADLNPLMTAQPARMVNTGLVSRRAWQLLGGFDEQLRVGQPIDLLSRANKLRLRQAQIDETTILRRIHDDNISRTTESQSVDYLKVVRAHLARGQ